MDCRDQRRAASAGGILATRLQVAKARRASSPTARCATRPRSRKLGSCPSYAQGASPLTNLVQHHATDINVPIGCAEVADLPRGHHGRRRGGRRLHPAHLADEVAEAAPQQEKLERFIQYEISNGEPLRGTYPPDEDTLRRYPTARSSG